MFTHQKFLNVSCGYQNTALFVVYLLIKFGTAVSLACGLGKPAKFSPPRVPERLLHRHPRSSVTSIHQGRGGSGCTQSSMMADSVLHIPAAAALSSTL
jgi:hypothetical protein